MRTCESCGETKSFLELYPDLSDKVNSEEDSFIINCDCNDCKEVKADEAENEQEVFVTLL